MKINFIKSKNYFAIVVILSSCLSTQSTLTIATLKKADKHYQITDQEQNTIVLKIIDGDITRLSDVDVIVNAANSRLIFGGGVCGAIYTAAGGNSPTTNPLDLYMRTTYGAYTAQQAEGTAYISPSFNLKKIGIKNIIHAIGPDCRLLTNTNEIKTRLKNAYANSLRLAAENKLERIAFPILSVGIFGCNATLAITAAIEAFLEAASEIMPTIKEIHLVIPTKLGPANQKIMDICKTQLKFLTTAKL